MLWEMSSICVSTVPCTMPDDNVEEEGQRRGVESVF